MSLSFSEIPFVPLLEDRKSRFLPLLEEVFEKASEHLSTRIPYIFPNYTLHNIDHSVRILTHIEELIDNVDELNDFELVLLLCTAFLHDIGMGPDKETIEAIKSGELTFANIKYKALLKKYDDNEEEALGYLIRNFHADISSLLIKKYYSENLNFPQMPHINFVEEVCKVCEGHTKDFLWIDKNIEDEYLKADYLFNLKFTLSLLRLGDILDIDGNRTPLILYQLIKPTGFSDKEWKKHYVITNKQKVRRDRQTDEKAIYLYGECDNPEIHRSLLEYIEYINKEINNALDLSKNYQDKHKLYLRSKVEDKIISKDYTLSSLKLEIDFKAISNLLMGEKIYGDKKLGLREIIQNSIDACFVRKAIEDEKKEFEDEPYEGTIKIIIDKKKDLVTILDNGIGMDDYVIRKYFLSIGKSFYRSDDYVLQDLDYNPIGNFGIGFLSCFMLSDNAMVYTRKATEIKAYKINLNKNSEYVSYTEVDETKFVGTKIDLSYSDFFNVFNDVDQLKKFIKDNFLFDELKFHLINKNDKEKILIENKLFEFDDSKSVIIPLSDYLHKIEGYAEVKLPSNLVDNIQVITRMLKTKLEDLVVLKSNGDVVQPTESYHIKDLLNEGRLKYIELSLYDDFDNDDLNKLYEVLDDIEDAMWQSDPTTNAYILLESEIFENFESGITNYYSFDKYESLDFQNSGVNLEGIIQDFFSGFNCRSIIAREIEFYSEENLDLTIPIEEKSLSRKYDWEKNYIEFYLRNVLIEDFKSSKVKKSGLFNFYKIKVNGLNEVLVPNISRNRFDDSTTKEISDAISYGIHMGISDLDIYSKEENEFLKRFCVSIFEENKFIV